MRKDLTAEQKDYARFLPALSGFYATYVGKQRFDEYVDKSRIPSNFTNGVESLNYLNNQEGQFQYQWTLYSAGHAELDVNKHSPKEDMVRNRDRSNTWVLGDSGGFQIGKGVWEGDWKNPNCPKAQKKRDAVLRWMDAYMDYGMILDIPAWVCRSPAGREATGITTYMEAVEGTYINNDYWIANRTGACKFLNVLQGENHAEADDWYDRMKKYCDPKQYPDNHFNGWAMGGQNMCDVHLVLKRIVTMHFDGLLEKGIHDVMHFLGTSKLEWACLLTDIQRAVRANYNENFVATFDCASPFLATANGQIYIQNETEDRGKWTYRMMPSVDELKYATDTRTFRDAVIQDGIFKNFEDSPISAELLINDVCTYKKGDRNKIGVPKVSAGEVELDKNDDPVLDSKGNPIVRKKDSTSWDSFSYAIQMGHNVWSHINAVQEANRQYDNGVVPKMLVQEKFDRIMVRDVINEIFAIDNKEEALAKIEEYSKFWMAIPGTRGAIGKKTVNASTHFNALFDVEEPEPEDEHEDGVFSEEEETKLENLDEQLD